MFCFQSHLIGIVVPDPEVFIDWVKERGIVGSYEELCQNPVCDVTLVHSICHLRLLQCFLLLDCVNSEGTDLKSSLTTGCEERSVRRHDSRGEGSWAEVI